MDCGEPITVMVKDGTITSEEPPGLIGHVSAPFGKWLLNKPHS